MFLLFTMNGYFLLIVFMNFYVCSCSSNTTSFLFRNFLNYYRYVDQSIRNYGFNRVVNSSVSFKIITRNTNVTGTNIDINNLEEVQIMKGKRFKILIDGYYSSDLPLINDMVNEYLKKENVNIVIVDFSILEHDYYPVSAGNTLGVGKIVGNFIIELNRHFKIPYEDFHLVGSFLGAHVAGFAGKQVKNVTGFSIGRITGLDPAGPLFNNASMSRRLNSSDALFVDVIHTDRKIMGIKYYVGHSDFYPNDGKAPQPYCRNILSFITKYFTLCSHILAVRYFIESINSFNFVASKCDEHTIFGITLSKYTSYILGYCKHYPTAIMGENCDKNTRGQYFLTVNSNSPFARGK